MKKFKYKAQSYLKLLIFKREEALKELTRAESFKNKLLRRYENMEIKMKQSFEMNSQFGKAESLVEYININNDFIQYLKSQMKELSQEIAQAEGVYRDKYKKLLQLQVEVKKIELHKENQEKEYRKEQNKKNEKKLADINSTRQRGNNAESI